jgi:hypothetical protein
MQQLSTLQGAEASMFQLPFQQLLHRVQLQHLLLLLQVDWFFTREQEASTEALAHRWDPAGSAAVARLEAFLEQVGAL